MLSDYDLRNVLVKLKNSNPNYFWLNDVGSVVFEKALFDLGQAYKRFLLYRKNNNPKYTIKQIKDANKTGICLTTYDLLKHPKFKSKKKSKPCFSCRSDRTTLFTEENTKNSENWKKKLVGTVSITNCGYVKYQANYDLSCFNLNTVLRNPRVLLVNNKWILSFTVETDENQVKLNDYSCGVDVGIKNLATVSCKDEVIVYKNINKTPEMKKKQKKLKRLQRKLSKCQKDSKRRQKAKDKYSAYSKHISNIRQNYLHNCSADIIKKLPKQIIVETVSELSWLKNKQQSINREVMYSGVSEFLRQLKYKSQNNGIKFIKADKYYPSTQICSCCGNRKKLNLNERIYHCDVCGLEVDRDVNAAKNLEHYNYK